MQANITTKLRDFWDANIRGPDFVWADLLARGRAAEPSADDEEGDGEDDEPATTGSGSKTRLKPWHRRAAKPLGEPTNDGKPAPPLIDCLHRTMRLWKTGEQSRVDGYLEAQGLWRNDLFKQVVQAVLKLAKPGTDERATLAYTRTTWQRTAGRWWLGSGGCWRSSRVMFGSSTGIWPSLLALRCLARAGIVVAERWADADPRPE